MCQKYSIDAYIYTNADVCIDFIPQVFESPNTSFEFGIILASELFKKYPLAVTLNLAQSFVLPKFKAHCLEIMQSKESPLRDFCMSEAVRTAYCLFDITYAFPSLEDPVILLIIELESHAKGTFGSLAERLVSTLSQIRANIVLERPLSRNKSLG